MTEGRIEVRINSLAQLFNSLDPSPFRERDLDVDAEEHIVGWARELPRGTPLRVVVHLPQDEAKQALRLGLQDALRNYFATRATIQDRELRELFRNGWRYLSIGVPVLVLCLVCSQIARAALSEGWLARIVEESLIIVGWVANWRPIETFLYGWWPLKRRRDLYRQLASASVDVVSRHETPGSSGAVPLV